MLWYWVVFMISTRQKQTYFSQCFDSGQYPTDEESQEPEKMLPSFLYIVICPEKIDATWLHYIYILDESLSIVANQLIHYLTYISS